MLGTVKAAYDNDVWSEVTSETGSFDNPIRYAGEYFDAESGNVYLRARYYDPTGGRFLSEDPVKDGLNWYSYCGGNPVNFVDFWGLALFDPFSTPDEVAADFGKYIGQQSIEVEEEYAACIYVGIDTDGNKYYFYDIPRNELETHEERATSFYISWDGSYGDPIAITHIHGAYDAIAENDKDGFSTPNNVLPGDPTGSDTYNADALSRHLTL